MLAFKRDAVALVVLAFYFLVLDQQIEIAAALTFAAPKEVEEKAINSATNCPSQDKARYTCVVVAEKPILLYYGVNFTFPVGRIRNDLCLCFLP